jgi:hypothetical protein
MCGSRKIVESERRSLEPPSDSDFALLQTDGEGGTKIEPALVWKRIIELHAQRFGARDH